MPAFSSLISILYSLYLIIPTKNNYNFKMSHMISNTQMEEMIVIVEMASASNPWN